MNELQENVRKLETEEMRRKEEEERLRLGSVCPLQKFPVPDWTAVNEQQSKQNAIPIEFEPIVDTIVENPGVHPVYEHNNNEKEDEGPFKRVAPPEELNLSDYGYASKHPDYKLAEYMAHREYDKLESKGYPEEIKDKDGDKVSRKRKAAEEVGPLYIVHPKSSTMYVSCTASTSNSSVPGSKGPEVIELEVRDN